MSSEQIVNAYVQGEISRRTLVRRLLAGGISLGAAVSYAQLLRPARAAAGAVADLHGPAFTYDIVEQNLGRIIRNGFIKVRVSSDGPQFLTVFLHLYRRNSPWPDAVIGYKGVSFSSANTKTVKVPLDYNGGHSLDALRNRKRAKVAAATSDGDVPPQNALDVAVLTR